MLLDNPGNAITGCPTTAHVVLRNRRYERTIDADYRILAPGLPPTSRPVLTREPRLSASIALLAIAIALTTLPGSVTGAVIKPVQPQVVMQA